MDQTDLVRRFHLALPAVREWIDNTLENYRSRAVPVFTLGFPRLEKSFPPELLERARVVSIQGKVPYPPISEMGLPELQPMESTPFSGITFRDTYFVREDLSQMESLHFHELIHVIQWDRLGVDRFLLAYGFGLFQSGYRNSPLEQMAYNLQERFERQELAGRLVDFINGETDTLWSALAPLLLTDSR